MSKSAIKTPYIHRKLIFVVADIFSVIVALILSALIDNDFNFNNVSPDTFKVLFYTALVLIPVTLLICHLVRLYKSVWTFVGLYEFFGAIVAALGSAILYVAILNTTASFMPNAVDIKISSADYILYFFFMIFALLTSRFSYRFVRFVFNKGFLSHLSNNCTRVMLVGAGAAGTAILREINTTDDNKFKVICVIDDNEAKWGKYLFGSKIVGGRDSIVEIAENMKIDEIFIAIPSADPNEKSKLIDICQKTKCRIKVLPGLHQLMDGTVNLQKMQEIRVDDLLGRDPIKTNLESVMSYVSGKIVMVTGGGGSIGSELCRQIANYSPKQLIIVDIYENNAYDIQQELKAQHPELDLVVLVASVRNTERVRSIFKKYHPQIVYHAAAHKHVPLMEDSPNEAVKNNVFGTLRTVRAADEFGAERFVLISTDKAVNPTNVMGATKRICEMIVQTYNNRSKTEFVAVRFGNVLGSNGSVIPLFKKQIAAGGPVKVTHPNIIRYFMTIPEAVSLVLQAGASAKGGEIFVLDMGKPVKILDLATNLIRLSGYTPGKDIKIEFTGLRPGEKLYEELLMSEEGLQSTENHLIHIGKPIEFNEELFLEKLDELYHSAYNEIEDIRPLIKDIVCTYHTPDEVNENAAVLVE